MLNPRIKPVVKRHRERVRFGRIERDGGIERPPNT